MLEAVVSEVVLLEEPFGTVVMMRFYDELSPKEIAKRLGLPEGTVRSRLSRGLAMLRERLDSRVGPRGHWATVLAPAAIGGAMGAGAKAAVAAVAAILVLAPLAIWTFGNREHERTTGSSADHAAAQPRPRRHRARVAELPGRSEVAAASDAAADRASTRGARTGRAARVRRSRPRADSRRRRRRRDPGADRRRRDRMDGRRRAAGRSAPRGEGYQSSFWDPTRSEQALMAQGRRLTSGPDGAFEIPGTPARVVMIAKHGDRWGAFRGRGDLDPDDPDGGRSQRLDRGEGSGRTAALRRPRRDLAPRRAGKSAREWRGVTGPDGRAEVRHAQQLRPDGKRTGLAYGVDVFGEKPVEDATTTGPATVRLTLPRTAALRVSVMSGAARGGGSRVTIRARRASSQDEPGGLTGIVGPLGDVEFPFVAPMTEMAIEASDPDLGIAPASQFVVTSQPGGSVATVISLGEGGRRFRAIDESTGKPLAGRTLFRLDQASTVVGEFPFFSTDAEGRARIPAGEGGSIDLGSPDDLRVRWLVARVDVPSGAEDLGDVTFKVAPVLAAGRVKTADGAPAAGVNVRGEREVLSARGTPMGWLSDQASRGPDFGRRPLRAARIRRGASRLRVAAGSGGPFRTRA